MTMVGWWRMAARKDPLDIRRKSFMFGIGQALGQFPEPLVIVDQPGKIDGNEGYPKQGMPFFDAVKRR
jgi:hypothetical protein